MTRYRPALFAFALLLGAGPASATTPSTTPDCAEHGHDAEHNPHCDDETTTTTTSTTTTTTLIPGLPANPTTTTILPTTTTVPAATIEPPHLDTPPAVVAATTTTTRAPTVLSTHVEKLPTTGTPVAFYAALGLLCLLIGGSALYASRIGQ